MLNTRPQTFILSLVFLSGMAALLWEVLWQVKSSLALGVSAWGTALTLAATMGGMSLGAFAMGHILKTKTVQRPLRIYGALEWVIGISGLFLGCFFHLVEQIDSWAYAHMAGSTVIVHILGIVASLGIPTMAMGATLPVLGLISRQTKTSLAIIYGTNTLGAAIGTLLAAFTMIPLFGITATAWVIAVLNIAVGTVAWLAGSKNADLITPEIKHASPHPSSFNFKTALCIVFVTGFATFLLEVSWFRSLTAAFTSTTDAFAIMLACVLIALGAGPALVPALKKNKSLGVLLGWAGIFILLVTPVIERFDIFIPRDSTSPAFLFLQWFFISFYVIVTPVLLLGMAVPWLLDEQGNSRKWGVLYATNTLAAIIGSITAGWILLPSIGFAATAWFAGVIVVVTGLWIAPSQKRKSLVAFGGIALVVAVYFQSGGGHTRVLGAHKFSEGRNPQVLKTYEGPDSTTSVIRYNDDSRALFINGFVATEQGGVGEDAQLLHYMSWMGHLPMIAHKDPESALVICFGTGQTANAVRNENPKSLDIVDINPNVFKLAQYFPANEDVLSDPRVTATVMDGRAYLRRTDKSYDVITLEPMPPTFAGVNSLYSKEFYQLAKSKLGNDGVIAQWLPFHLVGNDESKAIAKTFQSVFPNAILWTDPPSTTGILLGSADDVAVLGLQWPGYARPDIQRNLTQKVVRDYVLMDRRKLESYAAAGRIITDDNQLLAYGHAARAFRDVTVRGKHELLKSIKPYKAD